MEHVYDVIIIGAGPAGLGSAVYAARAGLDALVIERAPIAGGQIINTTEVDNYLGLPHIGGFEMGDTFKKHAELLGTSFVEDEIQELVHEDESHKVVGRKNSYLCKNIVLAMGAKHALLGVPGEKEYTGMGVSYCATCDGAFFRSKTVAVIGGGDVAVGDALFLAGLCEKVILIHRRDSFRASGSLVKKLAEHENISIMFDTVVNKIDMASDETGIVCSNTNTKDETMVKVDGVFIAVGMVPQTDILGMPELDEKGYVIAGEDCETSIRGVYAAGDIRTKKLRQVITAVADGANAIASIMP